MRCNPAFCISLRYLRAVSESLVGQSSNATRSSALNLWYGTNLLPMNSTKSLKVFSLTWGGNLISLKLFSIGSKTRIIGYSPHLPFYVTLLFKLLALKMPDRKMHNRFNKLLLGNSFSSVSRIMDEPYSRFRGRHRNLRHDTVFLLETLRKSGIHATLGSWMHMILDFDPDLAETMKDFESLRLASGEPEPRGSGRRVRRRC